ncbi:hypothetical protein [Aquiflexum lacus]|uniref:hypothetical protein n=1 Tax=Aquiflexum lacus TaxID=2483805 RepID=UPI0018938D44|nr:hypothetical protein [Aquiflexum lacus]
MRPNKVGQVVRFHTPYPDEDPNMIYHLLDFDERNHFPTPSADIQVIFSDLSFVPINRVRLEELEVVEFDLKDLMRYKITVIKEDNTEAVGRVVKLHQEKIIPELSVIKGKGVMTNALITIKDFDGQEHTGFLFVTPNPEFSNLIHY